MYKFYSVQTSSPIFASLRSIYSLTGAALLLLMVLVIPSAMAQQIHIMKTTTPEECRDFVQSNREYFKFLMEDDLKVTADGGKSILSDLFGKNYPPAIRKIRSHKLSLPLTTPPEGLDFFYAILKDTEAEECSCITQSVQSDMISWSKGQGSIFEEVVNEWTERMNSSARLENIKLSAHFKSFEEAQVALSPFVEDDGSSGISFIQNPMSLKGKIIIIRMNIVQVLGQGKFLLTNLPTGFPEMDGKFYYGYIVPTYGGPQEFIDDQIVHIVGEITGTHKYPTPFTTSKTVPKIKIYGIRSGAF